MKQVYLIQSLEDGYFKIGVSQNPKRRLKQLQTGNSSKLKLLMSYPSEHANKIERSLHNLNSYRRKEGEWFDIPLTEALDLEVKCRQLEENFIILKKNGNVFI